MNIIKKIVWVFIYFIPTMGMVNGKESFGFLNFNRIITETILGYLDTWSPDTDKRIRLKAVTPVTQVKFSPDNQLIACIGYDENIVLNNINTGLTVYKQHENTRPLSIAFSPNGNFFATGAGNKIILWGLKKDSKRAREKNEKEALINTRKIEEKHMDIQDMQSDPYNFCCHEFQPRDVEKDVINNIEISFSANNKYIVGVFSGAAEIETSWHTDGKYKYHPRINSSDGTKKRWTDSGDGEYIAYYVEDKGRIEIYNTRLVHVITASDNITFMSFSHNASIFIYAHESAGVQNIYIYKKLDNTWNLKDIIPVKDPIVRLALSANGKYIAWITMLDKELKNDKLFFAQLGERKPDVFQISLAGYELQKELQFSKDSNFLMIGLTQRLLIKKLTHDTRIPYVVGILSTKTKDFVNIITDPNFVFTKQEGNPAGFSVSLFKTHLRIDSENYPIALSNDSLYLAIGSVDGNVHIWKNQAVELRQVFEKIKNGSAS